MAFLEHVDIAPTETYSPSARPFIVEKSSAPSHHDMEIAGSFQRGLSAYHRGDYSRALIELEYASHLAFEASNFATYVESCSYILRILAEREDHSTIHKIERSVLAILSNEAGLQLPPNLKSRALYVLGICNCYEGQKQESRHDLATTRFREAIDYAMLSGDKKALASPLYGVATVLYARHRYEDAIRELDRLNVLTSCLELPDLKTAAYLLRSMIRRNQGRFDEALDSAWKAFEALKHHPHLVLYLHSLCVIGEIFTAKGDRSSAHVYLDLAERSLKRDELTRISRLVDKALAALGASKLPDADLIFDTRTGLLIEKYKGEVHFEGQFILRDLLKIFLENPGRTFNKQELAEQVWREPYNTSIHDNKIYVTIKRLRQLLESSSANKYILRAKTGYFLNPKIRVLINDQHTLPAGETAGNMEILK